ncbi:heavy-metal-associated domain-containing protein [Amycolatopsis sp. cg5]|uniref:heavy-metal-associated domain-containing protein n=1 Tax=Amycolatopsis sp. cg5 TaxID=3238802 RepID=UPI0035252581
MTETTFAVSGMTCGHCVSSVREEVGELPGVQTVEVDLGSGRVQVSSDNALDFDQLEQAVRTAGYQLVR